MLFGSEESGYHAVKSYQDLYDAAPIKVKDWIHAFVAFNRKDKQTAFNAFILRAENIIEPEPTITVPLAVNKHSFA